MSARRVLITGIAGQDGTYLARLAAARGDRVVGVTRHAAAAPAPGVEVHVLDITDRERLDALIGAVRPDECYHLAAHHRSSQVKLDISEAEEEALYLRANLGATQALLAALHRHSPACRVLLAGSCHMFGDPATSPQNEATPLVPNSLYGITKTAALHLGRVYRRRHGLYCCTAILYNHESPLRRPEFVSARIARAAVALARGRGEPLALGDLDATVDWGYAGDYAQAMALMLQQSGEPEDLVVATGELHTVRDFVQLAFDRVGLDWRAHVRQETGVHRPVSRTVYHGDITRIRAVTGWSPTTSFAGLVHAMVDHYAESMP